MQPYLPDSVKIDLTKGLEYGIINYKDLGGDLEDVLKEIDNNKIGYTPKRIQEIKEFVTSIWKEV
jgi:hypothetical protein